MAAFLVHAVSQIFSHLQQTNGSTYKGTALFLNYRRSAVGGSLKIHFNHFAEKPIFKRFHRKTLCVLTHTHTHWGTKCINSEWRRSVQAEIYKCEAVLMFFVWHRIPKQIWPHSFFLVCSGVQLWVSTQPTEKQNTHTHTQLWFFWSDIYQQGFFIIV